MITRWLGIVVAVVLDWSDRVADGGAAQTAGRRTQICLRQRNGVAPTIG
jgi:hypothetical protein